MSKQGMQSFFMLLRAKWPTKKSSHSFGDEVGISRLKNNYEFMVFRLFTSHFELKKLFKMEFTEVVLF